MKLQILQKLVSICLGLGCLLGFATFITFFVVWDRYRHETCPDPNYPALRYDGGDHFSNGCYGSSGRIDPTIVQETNALTCLIVAVIMLAVSLCFFLLTWIFDGLLLSAREADRLKRSEEEVQLDSISLAPPEAQLVSIEVVPSEVNLDQSVSDNAPILNQVQSSDHSTL